MATTVCMIFLGVDEAREFDQLPPEESKARLGKIVDRIDSNEDGYVTLDEMRDWIRFTQVREKFLKFEKLSKKR